MFSNVEQMTTATQWGIVIGASLIAAVTDLRTRRIPNMLTFPLLIAGLVWAGWANGLWGVANAAGACLWLAFPFLLLFIFAGGGAGDAKLMGAIGVWLGISEGTIVLVCVMIAGIIISLCKAAIHQKLKLVLTNVFISVYTSIIYALSHNTKPLVVNQNSCAVSTDTLTIPYGIAIFAGVCIAGSLRLI
ncbi:MAG: prepilin peptidase [Sedimentisphaerales bacterium]|nr:prepilin peptidase [Sedimentisphaerales bacterium]